MIPTRPAEPPPEGRTWVKVMATAYCPCRKCCGPYTEPVTSIGRDLATDPYGIAADHTLLPPNTVLTVPGYGTATVDDTGSAMRKSGEEKVVHIDLRYKTHEEALEWGRRWLWIAVPSDLPAAALAQSQV
jgi:3D (Asp-Asp-Asp) domain-containing protein